MSHDEKNYRISYPPTETSTMTHEPITARQIAKASRVPYWLISTEPRPSWFRHPLWRLRAVIWARARSSESRGAE
jgi:hypothetical protein